MLCDKLEEWNAVGSGSDVQEGGDRYILIVDSCCFMAETQHCKAAIPNFKKFLREKKYLHCRMVILDTQSRLPMRAQGAVWRVFTVKATAKLV